MVLDSFHADGTLKRRTPEKEITNINYMKAKATLKVMSVEFTIVNWWTTHFIMLIR